MNTHPIASPAWSTASFGNPTDTLPTELIALGAHLNLCKGSHGRLSALHGAAQAMHGFAASRFITTLVLIALLIGAGSLVI